MTRWTILPALAAALWFSPAMAVDPLGTWVPDAAAVERNAARYADAMVTQVTPEGVARLKQQVTEMERQIPLLRQQDPEMAERLAENVSRAREMAAGLEADPKGFYHERMKRLMGEGELRVLPDGEAAWIRRDDGVEREAAGEWSMDGDTISLTQQSNENPKDSTRFSGEVEEERMELKMVLTPEQEQRMSSNPEMLATMRDTTYVLVRK